MCIVMYKAEIDLCFLMLCCYQVITHYQQAADYYQGEESNRFMTLMFIMYDCYFQLYRFSHSWWFSVSQGDWVISCKKSAVYSE